MPRFPENSLVRLVLILAALILAGLVSTPLASGGEPDTPPTTNLGTQPRNQVQPTQSGTKTKLQPTDLLPSLLSPRIGAGSVDNLGSTMSRDTEQLRRSGRLGTRINQDLRRLNNNIRGMNTNMNRALRIRRQRF
jgi:hypothetical protein